MSGELPSRNDVPESLLEFEQWVCWREAERGGKVTKIPVDPSTGDFASTTDSATWNSFEAAREQALENDEAGVGFVFSDDDPFVGVDLDDCLDPETGTASEWAADVIASLASYAEISPSGTGFHVLVEGRYPFDRNRKGDVEVYDSARFFTVTGNHVEATPLGVFDRTGELVALYEEYLAPDEDASSPAGGSDNRDSQAAVLDDEVLLSKARSASNGAKFERLWRGSTSGYESHSETDMALCSLLAFWTGGDERQMDRLFRESGLYREKWDEQHFADGSTYGEKTIERAVAGTSEFYEPSTTRPGDSGVSEQSPAPVDFREREANRVERIAELEQRLSEVLTANEELEATLVAERERRQALEAELSEERDSGDGVGLFSWF